MIAYEAAEAVALNVAGGAIKAALQSEIANVIADLQPEEAAAFTGRLTGMIAYEVAEGVLLNVAGGAIKAGKLPKMIAALENLPGVDPAKLGQLAKAAGDKALPLIDGLVKRDVDDVVKKVAPKAFFGKSVDDLSKAGRVLDPADKSGQFTKAGRSLTKHQAGARAGSTK